MTLSLHPDVVAALRQYPGQAGRLVDEAIAARLGLQLRGAPPPAQAVAPQTQAAAVVPAAKAKTIEQQLDEYVSDPNGHPLSLIAAKAMLRSGQGLPKGARLIRRTAIDEVDIDRLVQAQVRAIDEGDTEF